MYQFPEKAGRDTQKGIDMALTVMQSMSGPIWIAHPDCAPSPLLARRLLLGTAAASLPIALCFSAIGAWPVLPFAGLELLALWLALQHLGRHANDEERICVNESVISVTQRTHGWIGEHTVHHEFSRHWVQLRIERPPDHGGARSLRLLLRSHGHEVEIGRMLTEEQKRAFARQLKQQLDAR